MDVTLADLWLPILLSAVIVFIASALAWMVLPHHKADVRKLPDEPSFLEHFRSMGLKPGQYMWPNCADSAEMKSDEFKKRYSEGPWGNMIVPNGKPNFARNLALVFVFYIVVGVFVAYVTSNARPAGAEYMSVFQVAGAVAFATYVLGGLPHAIFFGRPVRALITDAVDGFVYAMLTAGVFAGFWPNAPTATDLLNNLPT